MNNDVINWLLEPDQEQPAIRYFTLRDILGYTDDSNEVKAAKSAIMLSGPVPRILAAQEPEGFWLKSGPGYSPKYRSTVWQVIFLAQLGADGTDPRVQNACSYVLSHSIVVNKGFSVNGTPSYFIHCLAGNLGAALIDLGWLDDNRLQTALEWQARLITGFRIASSNDKDTSERYFAITPGPLFACGPNIGLSCAWGAVKAMLAFGKVPSSIRTSVMQDAIDQGVEFLSSHDPAVADYPFGRGNMPNSSWFKLGYPIGYVTDVLQNLEAFAALDRSKDTRLSNALDFISSKQNRNGRWKMEYSLNGKMWADIEKKGQYSKWVTLRALRVLKSIL
ncbi:nitrogen fixation protein NifH [Chloroflexota bacterium]